MYLVLDIGATSIKHALMSAQGDILEKGKTPTPMEKDKTIDDFVHTVGQIYDSYKSKLTEGAIITDRAKNQGAKTDLIQGIAIGIPGQVDVKRGIVYNGGGIRYMHDIKLQDLIEARCDNISVSIENDAKCTALAEVWKGNAKDVKNACVLVFGTGIGGALIKDRRVIHGKHLLAGEVSLVLDGMTRDDLDALPEGEGIVESMSFMECVESIPFLWSHRAATINVCHWVAKKRGLKDEEVSGEKLYQWAESGDQEIIDTLEEWYFSIAKQCLNMYVIFNPEVILIGGGISAEPRFVEGIQRYVNELKRISNVYSKIKVDSCKFYNDSNLLGALYNFKLKYARSDESCTK